MSTAPTASPPAPAQAARDALRVRFRGDLITPEHPDYDDARRVWNGMIDRRPAMIARCLDADDVASAIAYATEADLPLAVRGGGHNVAGYATCDDGVVVDLSPMRRVVVDPVARIAAVDGGAIWADVDAATEPFGLVTPGGEVSLTGVAGLTLSGGYGVFRRSLGLSCDNLVAAEVVTARGDRLRASADEHPDLLWALRGGGGNFGVVTRFEFALHALGPNVYKCTLAFPIGELGRVLRRWRAFVQDAPDEVTSTFYTWRVPDVDTFPSELCGVAYAAIEGAFAGPADHGARHFAALHDLGAPLFDLSGVVPYVEAQRALDPFMPSGGRYYWKSTNLASLDDDVIAGIESGAASVPAGPSLIVVRHLGGAIARVAEDATAYGNRSAPFNLSIDASWWHPDGDEANVAWARGFWQAMQPHASGVYLNFIGHGEEGQALVRAGHGRNYDRLARIKATYDPGNLFRLNQNVEPATEA